MKKIIWVFGHNGSGKTKLIEDLENDRNSIKELLGLEGAKIASLNIPGTDIDPTSYGNRTVRKNAIYNGIYDFVNSPNHVLLIKGRYSDQDGNEQGIMHSISKEFPTLEKDILYLCPSNLDDFYSRLQATEWFKKDADVNKIKYPKEWLQFSSDYYRKNLLGYEAYGYKVTEIDTLDGYKVKDENGSKVK